MKTKIIVHVSQDDIEHGCRCNGLECPVALAFRRVIDQKRLVLVFDRVLSIEKEVYELAETAGEFIRKFDRTGKRYARPFTFEIEVSKKFLRSSAKQKITVQKSVADPIALDSLCAA